MLFNETIQLPLDLADVSYTPLFYNKLEADELYNKLYNNINWQQDEIKVFGKTYNQPRLTALFGENNKPYTYSNITMYPQGFTGILAEIKYKIEQFTNTKFTTCLANLYRDGNDSNGWHSDNEKELGTNPIIASLSLGATRQFHLKQRNNKNNNYKLALEHGSLLLMKGETQHHWLHQIAKTKRQVQPRINLTFRIIK